jgi:hypothetical protein
MTGLPTVGGSLVGSLLAMARRTALAPGLGVRGGFFVGLAAMTGAEILLLVVDFNVGQCQRVPSAAVAITLALAAPAPPATLLRGAAGILNSQYPPYRRQACCLGGRAPPALAGANPAP